MTFITIAVLFSVLNLLTYSDTAASDAHAVLEAAPTPRLALLAEPPQRVGAAATPPGAGVGAGVRATAGPDGREGRPGLAGASRAPTQAAQGAGPAVAAAGAQAPEPDDRAQSVT